MLDIQILKDEYWWGGLIKDAENMPYSAETVLRFDLERNRCGQSAPLYLSSKGRYIWSEEPFIIEFNR